MLQSCTFFSIQCITFIIFWFPTFLTCYLWIRERCHSRSTEKWNPVSLWVFQHWFRMQSTVLLSRWNALGCRKLVSLLFRIFISLFLDHLRIVFLITEYWSVLCILWLITNLYWNEFVILVNSIRKFVVIRSWGIWIL